MNFSVICTSQPVAKTVYNKVSLILLPVLGGLLCIAAEASAQVVPAAEGSSNTVVDVVGDHIDISGGQLSHNNENLFQSFEQFDINAQQTANFVTPADVQNIVGRIDSSSASSINGTLQVSGSDANLYLMNPSGILMGPDAQLNLSGGFTATTATSIGFEDGQFEAAVDGDYSRLTGDPSSFHFNDQETGAVVNLGELSVEEGQSLNLIGGTVVNAGSLEAPGGSITVAAVEGENVVRISQGEQLLSLEIEALSADGQNNNITPSNISSMLTGSGLSSATTLTTNPDGSVRLGSAEDALLETSGSTTVTGELSTTGDIGGNINVLGSHVLLSEATLDASGDSGGGLIRVGGDFQGNGPVFNAEQTVVDEGSTLLVNARAQGNGGTTIIWADNFTDFSGRIEARGGTISGDGGFSEVSGKRRLAFEGVADVSALNGTAGNVLLDPDNIVITDGAAPPDDSINSYISSSTVENFGGGTYTLNAADNITIQDLLDNELTLRKGTNLVLAANTNGNGIGSITMDGFLSDTIRAEEGDIEITGTDLKLGNLSTWTTRHDMGGGNSAGSVTLTSTQGAARVEEIFTYGRSNIEPHHSGEGGDVSINAVGDIVIARTIETDSSEGGREAGFAGNIELRTQQGNISVGSRLPNTDSDVLFAVSDASSYTAEGGGTVQLRAPNGTVDVFGNIATWARTYGDRNSSSSSEVGNGGSVYIEALNDITTGNITTWSRAEAAAGNDGNDAGQGGRVEILSTAGTATLGNIESYALAGEDGTLGGGDVIVRADSIFLESVNTSSSAEGQAENGGAITLEANTEIGITSRLQSYSHARNGDDAGDGGTIEITANNISLDSIESWSSARANSGKGGSIMLSAADPNSDSSHLSVGDISTFSRAESNRSDMGGDVFLSASTATVDGINTSSSADQNAGNGGDITIKAQTSLTINNDTVSFSLARNGDVSGNGGAIDFTANLIKVGDIGTWSESNNDTGSAGSFTAARFDSAIPSLVEIGSIFAYSASTNDNAGEGGDVTIRTDDIALGSINAKSEAVNNNASDGGDVILEAVNSVDVAGAILTSSEVGNRNAGDGGLVQVEAAEVAIASIFSLSSSPGGGTGTAGAVTLKGENTLRVGGVLATGNGTGSSDADISLIGNDLELVGGTQSIHGKTVQIGTTNLSQDINIGADGSSGAFNLGMADLSAVHSNVESLIIGQAGGTGTITLDQSVVDAVNSRPNIEIIGGQTLIGPTPANTIEQTIFLLEGPGTGQLEGSGIQFSQIQNLQGGNGRDVFRPTAAFRNSDFQSIAGGGGFNTIDYSELSSSVPFTIDLAALAIDDVQSLIGPAAESTLVGRNIANTWRIDGTNTGTVDGITFENFENLTGGSNTDTFEFVDNSSVTGSILGGAGNNTLDYSRYNTPISIDLENTSATGLDSFSNIEAVIGSNSSSDRIIGTSGDDSFTITGSRTGIINTSNLRFSDINILNGGAGSNTFSVEDLNSASEMTLIGGSDLPNQLSTNRLVSNSADALWQIDGTNLGSLRQANSTIVSFSEIQQLDNSGTVAGETTVLFSNQNSQITGSVTSGNNNLLLTGDDINLGRRVDTGDRERGSVSGSGTLTIRPNNSNVAIELGGVDSGMANTLNITTGELAALQAGFMEIRIESSGQGGIRLGGDAAFRDAVELRSQGDINTTGGELSTSAGRILLETDSRIEAGVINNQRGEVTLRAGQDITATEIRAQGGQGISLTSDAGSIDIQNSLDTSSGGNASNITLTAQTGVSVGGDIDASGSDRSGNVTITASSGSISTQGITTATGTENSDEAGSVSLMSPGSIEIEFIEATGHSSNTTRPAVSIDTRESVAIAQTISTVGNGIAINSDDSGSIYIIYGEDEEPAPNFSLIQQGLMTDSVSVAAGTSSQNLNVRNISVINRGIQPEIPTDSLDFSVTALQFRALDDAIDLTPEEQDDLFTQLETSIGSEFDQYLGLSSNDRDTPVATLHQAQSTLRNVEDMTGVTPALVYVYFLPDASTATSVTLEGERIPRPDDQLEVMLIVGDGEPSRHRQWGVTREQVESVGRELRDQATRQFSRPRDYLQPAQQLYDWIMQPIEESLEHRQVDSLGFVLDTGLRTVPLSTLHDGDQYLIEDYSIGLLPTFSLTDFALNGINTAAFDTSEVLAMGASKFEHQPDLPAVDAELKMIANENWEGDTFLNERFVLDNLRTQLQEKDYGVVHLATHATFESGDLDSSYIQFWDEQLSLSEVDSLPLSEAEVNLIILSACNTAMGDAASEYGFAGFAVSTGAPSAVASLWPVSDEGTLGFMSQFYGQLRGSAVRTEALRQAQIRLLSGEVKIDDGTVYGPDDSAIADIETLRESGRWDFSHPFYWSAFTMIGNPW